MLSGIRSALQALGVFQKKVESSANNIANVDTQEYKRQVVKAEETGSGGVAARVSTDLTPGPQVAVPGTFGEEYVELSNVELTEELPNLQLSKRYFQANLKAVQIEDEMLGSLLDIKK